jgi:hypothetical protein
MNEPDCTDINQHYPPDLPESDRAGWDSMSSSQRERAVRRLAALERWSAGEVGIDEAVLMSGVGRSRFYRLAADWRAAPGLKALGMAVRPGSSGP